MRRPRLLLVCCVLASGLLAAARGQGKMPTFLGKTADGWVAELKKPEPRARRSAAFALGKLGQDAPEVIDTLLDRLRADPDDSVRDAAAFALGELARLPESRVEAGVALPQLRKLLRDAKSKHVRRSAAYALGAFGPRAEAARADLVAALDDAEPIVKQNAAWALGRLKGKPDAATIDGLRKLVRYEPSSDGAAALVRRDAVTALGELDPGAAKAAAPDLLKLLAGEPDAVVRRTTLEKLVDLVGPDNAKDAAALAKFLADPDVKTRREAAQVFASIGGPEAAKAVAVLREALADADPMEVARAAAGLGRLGAAAGEAADDLGKLLARKTTPEERLRFVIARRDAAIALARFGAACRPALDALIGSLHDKQELPSVRRYSAEAIANLLRAKEERDRDKAVPALLRVIPEPTPASLAQWDKEGDRPGFAAEEELYEHRVMRQRCTYGLQPLPRDAFARYEADKVLTEALEEKDPALYMLCYDAARVLAEKLGRDAPSRAALVLVEMLKDKRVRIYDGTRAKVSGTGEGDTGSTKVEAQLGRDARFLAAQSLAQMGSAARKPEVIAALKAAEKEDEPELKAAAQQARMVIEP